MGKRCECCLSAEGSYQDGVVLLCQECYESACSCKVAYGIDPNAPCISFLEDFDGEGVNRLAGGLFSYATSRGVVQIPSSNF